MDIDENVNNEVPPQPNQALGNQVAVAQDWNPVIEWDRGAEDITWERVCLLFVLFCISIHYVFRYLG